MQITGPRKECNHRQVVMVLVEVESTKLIADVLIYSSGVLIHQKNKNLGKKFKTFYIKAIFIFSYCTLIQTILIVHQKKISYKSITDLLLYLITLLVTSIAAYRTRQRKSHNSQLPIFGFHFYSRKKENFLFLNHGLLGPNMQFLLISLLVEMKVVSAEKLLWSDLVLAFSAIVFPWYFCLSSNVKEHFKQKILHRTKVIPDNHCYSLRNTR